ncbi:MAG: transketolase, partial [Rhodoferax sp.]|nr:transketolase [Actinomycetota bacterium]
MAAPIASTLGWTDVDVRAVDTARVLAADAVQKVGNGHPGTAMSLAPVAYTLFQDVMRHDPADDQWLGRDRFVLSCGHSSLTLYIQLYLAGYGLELSDLQALRTWGSATPAHPEHRHTRGVEITTGPLGQGLASPVGMAMAARRERGLLDPDAAPGQGPFDHHVFVLASDGDLMEGVTAEASSLAGHQQLGNLVVIYDQNHISIEDDTNVAFSEDVAARYEAYDWHVQRIDWTSTGDYVEDVDALKAAIDAAKAETDRPSFIALRTIIGWPAPTKQNTGSAHGSALGPDEVAATKTVLGFDPERSFAVDADVIAHTRAARDRGREAHEQWQTSFEAWRAANPERATLLDRISRQQLPDGWTDVLPEFAADAKGVATRKASGEVLSALAPVLPELWGGSADLAESNNTTMEGEPSFVPTDRQTAAWKGGPYGRTLHFGIREHAMAAALNGIALQGLTRPYAGTFLVFSDYMRPAVRLAALMKLPVTYVWTHDSFGLGEDGSTHQPVEHLAALRAIPGLDVVRPGDANETAWAWRTILQHIDRPAGLVLTRQNLPVYDRSGGEFTSAEGV